MKKYNIFYNQKGGKNLDYLFYRILNSFISDKFIVLKIINSFPSGYLNTESNILQLRETLTNFISVEHTEMIMTLIAKIFLKNPNAISINLTDFDKTFFIDSDFVLSSAEISGLVSLVPNYKIDIVAYLNYLFSARKHTYTKDSIEYLMTLLTAELLKESSETDVKAEIKQFNKMGKIIKEKKKYIAVEEKKMKSIQIFLLNSKLEAKQDGFCSIQLSEPIPPELFHVLQQDIFYIIFPFNNDWKTDPNFRCKIIEISEDQKEFSFNFLGKRLEPFTEFQSLAIADTAYGYLNIMSSKIEKALKEIEAKEISMESLDLLKKQIKIDTREVTWIQLRNEILRISSQDGLHSKEKGDDYENTSLFLAVIKICLDRPDININNIRILTNMEMIHPLQKGEIDLMILNENDEIIVVGEIKSFIDGIHKAYNQFEIFKKYVSDTDTYFISKDNPGKQIKLKLAPSIVIQPKVEDNDFLYIILRQTPLNQLTNKSISLLLKYLYKNKMVKINLRDEFELTLSASDLTNLQVITSSGDLGINSSDIINLYSGKNNLIIFKNKSISIPSAYDILSKME
ncbi:hypothetical protein CPAV1605_731 [seawater metagenome]|uniref:Uncharacterized protein n=1 Tax=seawater metagenome TaxID=1561972 RepID=A0A5E8CIT1_9ZZZZ